MAEKKLNKTTREYWINRLQKLLDEPVAEHTRLQNTESPPALLHWLAQTPGTRKLFEETLAKIKEGKKVQAIIQASCQELWAKLGVRCTRCYRDCFQCDLGRKMAGEEPKKIQQIQEKFDQESGWAEVEENLQELRESIPDLMWSLDADDGLQTLIRTVRDVVASAKEQVTRPNPKPNKPKGSKR